MKAKIEIANNHGRTPSQPQPKRQLPEAVINYETISAARSRLHEIWKARKEKILCNLDSIFYYKGHENCGIAFNAEGQLVEFIIPNNGCTDAIEDTTTVQTITLAESLAWVEKMRWAEIRLDLTMQEGPGMDRWIAELSRSIKELTKLKAK